MKCNQPSSNCVMEDVHELMTAAIEDRTLLWVDSSRRDDGGTGSNYTVTMVEPLRNVVGIRVIEAIIPATVMSVDEHNSHLTVHTVAFDDDLPVDPSHILISHTAGLRGAAWRTHDATGKRTYYDAAHDSEHHVAHEKVAVYSVDSESALAPADVDDAVSANTDVPPVICLVPNDVSATFSPFASYDPVARLTAVSCTHRPIMRYVCEVELVAGVYRLPRGKYDSLRDFVAELQHKYSSNRMGVMLDFVQAVSAKPERTFRMQVDPAKVWTHVDTADGAGYEHTYTSKSRYWCAIWTGSSSIRTLGFQMNSADLQTAGGGFATSDTHERYRGRMRGRTMVDLSSERYVWLRCPEVERHMCTGVGKVLQRGIGVFRLDVPGVLNQDQTDYISVIPNQFHPISKVSKLSFRFDKGSRDNEPYDFREINHFMLISVSTLRPDATKVYATLPRALNSDYSPNAMEFQLREHDRRTTGTRPVALSAAEVRRAVAVHNAAVGAEPGRRV